MGESCQYLHQPNQPSGKELYTTKTTSENHPFTTTYLISVVPNASNNLFSYGNNCSSIFFIYLLV